MLYECIFAGAAVCFGVGFLRTAWFGASCYTRLLEDRVARLEAENAHLRNAIYARAGIGPVPLGPVPANGDTEKRLPQPIRRPVSWAQVKQKLETAAANQSKASAEGASSS